MQTVYCDICKKKIDDPASGRTLFHFERFGLCEPCKDSMELQIRPTVRNKEPFALEWYSKLVVDSIDKGVQKGKI